MAPRHFGMTAPLLAALAGGVSCLPADTRPAPGSILLVAASEDEPVTTTADGWAVAVDRLILGIGNASLGFNCKSYSDSRYLRLLDGRRPDEQKVSVIYGLGQCYFDFRVMWPSSDSVLGDGVSEADRDLMSGAGQPGRGPRLEGVAIDFAATAQRGAEIKRLHWMFSQCTTYYSCMHDAPGESSQSLDLRSNENLTFHLGIRGVALFGDDANSTTARLRFDPMAMADTTYGNADGEITLDELGAVDLDVVRLSTSGPYRVGKYVRGTPHSLEDYVHLVLLPWLLVFHEGIVCDASLGC